MGEVTWDGRLGYRLVNHAGRGGIPLVNRARQWLQRHRLDVTAEGKFVPQCIFTAPEATVKTFLQALFSGDGGLYQSKGGFFLEYYSKSRRLIEDVHHLLLRFGIFSLMRERVTGIGTEAHKIQITDVEQIGRFAEYIGFVPGSVKQRRLEEEIMPAMRDQVVARRTNSTLCRAEAWAMVGAAVARAQVTLGSTGVVRRYLRQSLPLGSAELVATATSDPDLVPLINGPVWDVVESIEPAGEEPVFDLTVPGPHNFVANGLIVHNSTYARCGIIVNVTPLEPEWEGYVTLEFSNTTPLPAEDLRQRGRGAGALLRVRRGLRDLVPRSRRQIPGPEGRHAAQDLRRRGTKTPPSAKKYPTAAGFLPYTSRKFFERGVRDFFCPTQRSS